MSDTRKFDNSIRVKGDIELPLATPSTATIVDSSGKIASSVTTDAELAFLSGTTSSVQDQIDAAQTAADDAQTDATQALADAAAAQADADSAQADATQALSDAADAQADIDAHISDTTGAHAASAISVTPTGNLAADDVQEALVELQGDIDGIVTYVEQVDSVTTSGTIATPTAPVIKLTNAALTNISGIPAPSGGRNHLIVINATGGTISITTNSGTNGILMGNTSDPIIPNNGSMLVYYSPTILRWIVVGVTGEFVDVVSNQTIAGIKTFTNDTNFGGIVEFTAAKPQFDFGIRLFDSGTFTSATFSQSATQSVDTDYILPPTNGAANALLMNDGTGVLEWSSVVDDLSDDVADLVTLSGVAANSEDLGTFTGSLIPDNQTVKQAFQSLETAVESLPDPMEYKGLWDASTNTPTLADGSGNNGDVYQVSVAGTVDFGAGDIVFAVGDKAVYNGASGEYEKWDMTDSVISVNGQNGIVVLDTDDIAEGSALYFTDERAQDAVGNILANSDTVSLSYNDGTPDIVAEVISQMSITSDASGLKLDGDEASPGNTQYYGTDGSGVKGFYSIPAVGSSGDIQETSFSAANNVAAPANVTGLAFANGVVRSFSAMVAVFIDATADQYEEFELRGIQKGASWDMSVSSVGDDSGFVFSITTAGQVQYTSLNSAGFVSSTVKFRALTLSV